MTRRQRLENDCLFFLTGGTGKGMRETWIENSRYWTPSADRRDFDRKLQAVRMLGGEISVLPRIAQDHVAFDAASCLWVRVETRDAAKRLSDFKVKPTLVLRDGETVKRTAFWWLTRELPWNWVLKANERLAYALHGLRKCAALSHMVVPPYASTGTQIVEIERITLAMYHPNEVVGGMKDPPDLEEARRRRMEKAERQAVAA